MPDVLVGRGHDVEASSFRGLEKLSILESRIPLRIDESMYFVPAQEAAHADGHVLIEQDA